MHVAAQVVINNTCFTVFYSLLCCSKTYNIVQKFGLVVYAFQDYMYLFIMQNIEIVKYYYNLK